VRNARNGHKTRRFDHYDWKLHLCYAYFISIINRHRLKTKHLGETWIEEFELFLRSSFELYSNFVQTFLQKKFELFWIVRKRKTLWNLFDFCQIFQFFEKTRTFPEVHYGNSQSVPTQNPILEIGNLSLAHDFWIHAQWMEWLMTKWPKQLQHLCQCLCVMLC
jgi:hypothetical protein